MSDKDSPDPIAERRDEVLKRMLNTPPKPHKPKEKKGREPKPAPKRKNELAIEALDALGLALADHGHKWSDRERQLYEAVTTASSSRKGSDWSASGKCLQTTPWPEQRRASGPF